MSITMKELATIAGVSRATVDRALNGRPGINEETATRIRALAKSMDYTPDVIAKSLAIKNKNILLGCIVNSEENEYFDDVESGMVYAREEVEKFGIQMVVEHNKKFSAQSQIEVIDRLVDKGVSHVVLTPVDDPLIREKINILTEQNINVVALSTDILDTSYFCYVGADHEKIGRIAANLLAQSTERPSYRVTMVIGSKSMLGHRQRLEGFQEAIAKDYPNISLVGVLENDDDDFISYEKVKTYLKQTPDLDAIFFASAGTKGGICAIRDLGRKHGLRVLAVDKTVSSTKYLREGLIDVVINQNGFEQGRAAVTVLSEHLLSGKRPEGTHVYIPIEIFVKESLPED